MKLSADFRQIARDVLRGKWTMAVIAGLIASLLGGLADYTSNITLNFDMSHGDVNLAIAGKTILSTTEGIGLKLHPILIGGALYIAVVAIVIAALYFVLGSVIEVGYSRFNLDLADQTDAKIETLFSYFSDWKTAAAARFLRGLYVFLWSLLFIIPGIVASYSYAMTGYILAEHPELTAGEALARSKEMMQGNKFRLFGLHLSFIGWSILCTFTFGIGNLWLTPYKNAASAAFYREVSGTEQTVGGDWYYEQTF